MLWRLSFTVRVRGARPFRILWFPACLLPVFEFPFRLLPVLKFPACPLPVTNLFIGMSVGANVVAAQFYGSGQRDKISDTIHTSVFLSLICGVAM